MKSLLITIPVVLTLISLQAQTDPLVEIEGRLSIFMPNDTTSLFIGKNAGKNHAASNSVTAIGINAGNKNKGFLNSYFGHNAGKDNEGAVQSMFQGSLNSFFGANAGEKNHLGSRNSFFGALAGLSNLGKYHDNSTNGSSNSFFGAECGRSNTFGSRNSFFGSLTGLQNISGNENSFFGYRAGNRTTGILEHPNTGDTIVVGSNNAFFGHESGYLNETGQNNTFIGSEAGYNNLGGEMVDYGEGYQFSRHGSDNTFLGNEAGYNNTSGRQNIYLGKGAGLDNTTGNNNIMIGAWSGNKVLGSNNIFLGGGPYIYPNEPDSLINWRLYIGDYEAVNPLIYGEFDNRLVRIDGRLESSGQIVLENASDIVFLKSDGSSEKAVLTLHTNNDTYLDGERHLRFRTSTGTDEKMIIKDNGHVGIGTSDPGHLLQVGQMGDGSEARANGWNTFSDKRWKRDLVPLKNTLENISSISGYYYQWRVGDDNSRQIGFLAQEIKKVYPEIVAMDSEGYLSVDYSKMSPLLLEAIKEQQETIEKQQRQIAVHRKEIENIRSEIVELKEDLHSVVQINTSSSK